MYSLVYKYIFLILTVELSKIESKGMKTKNQSITYLVVVIFLISLFQPPLRTNITNQC